MNLKLISDKSVAIAKVPESQIKPEFEKIELHSSRVLAILGSILVPLSVVTDYFNNYIHLNQFLIIRFSMVFIFLIVFVLALKGPFYKRGKLFSQILIFSCLIGLNVMQRILGYDNQYYAGLNLVYLATMILPWNAFETFITCFAGYLFYLVPVFLFDKNIEIGPFVNNNFFQIITILITTIVNHFQYQRRRNEIIHRITIAQQAEDLEQKSKDIEQKSVELKKSYDDLKRSEESKSKFISDIAHDVKSPLSVIRGQADVIKMIVEPGNNIWKKASFINKSALQLSGLIDKLTDVFILETEYKIELMNYEYMSFIKEQFAIFADTIKQRNINYVLEASENRVVVKMNKEWMERVYANLVMNAVKYTNTGGKITVKTYKDAEFIYTEVADTGIGIEKEKLGLIFERKYRANVNQKEQGFGLGLSIVKDALTMMNGEITVESELEKGSIFRYKLKMIKDQNEKGVNETIEISGAEKKNGKTVEMPFIESKELDVSVYENKNIQLPTILIVEDNMGQLDMIIDVLKDEYNLIFAQNGKEGLEKFKLYKNQVKLILCDVKMPEIDGIKLCGIIHSSQEGKDVPIVMLTAHTNKEEEYLAIKNGAMDYISKPVNAHVLKGKLQNLMGNK